MWYFALLLSLFFVSCSHKSPRQKDNSSAYVITRANRTPPKSTAETFKAPRPGIERAVLVVIDPGHGGESLGTKTVTFPHVCEKTLALQCSLQVEQFLRDWGYQVRMTRKKDESVPLQKRVQIAKGGTFFVSIHFNHAPNAEASGVEVFYYNCPRDPHRTDASKMLSQHILRFIVRETDCFSRGVHAGNFHVIRENTIPAVLVEGGFCSNVVESRKLQDPKYIKKLAFGIARGIDSFASR